MRSLGYVIAKALCRMKLLNNYMLLVGQKIYKLLNSAPSALQIHSTIACNLACDYCYSRKERDSVNIDWYRPLKEARRLKISHVDFLGGEPLLDNNMKGYIEFCHDNNMSGTIHTNGTLIDDDWILFLKKLNGRFRFSIKYDVKNEMDLMFGNGHYDNVIEKINLCSRNGIKVQVHSFINKSNYQDVSEMIEFATSKNLFLTIERYMSQGIREVDEKYSIGQEEWNSALDKYHAYCNGLSKDAIILGSIKGNACACYLDLISINVKGIVTPCPFACSSQAIGDVSRESLKNIWKKYKKKSREVWMKIPAECKSCKLKRICHGGCKTHVFMNTKRYDAKDPLCNESKLPFGIYASPKQ